MKTFGKNPSGNFYNVLKGLNDKKGHTQREWGKGMRVAKNV